MRLIVNAAVPEFVNVNAKAELLWPRVTVPKAFTAGVRETAAWIPVPVSVTLATGVPLSFVVKVRAAVRTPTAMGLNRTATRQLAPAPKLAGQLLLARLKSPGFAAVNAMLVIPSAAGPRVRQRHLLVGTLRTHHLRRKGQR